MSLPEDRTSLRCLAKATERAIEETAAAGDGARMQHAGELLRLGEIRFRLGESREAERLFDQSAIAFWKADLPAGREAAAAARIRQSNAAMADGRFDDALAVIERLVEQWGGFPAFPDAPDVRVAGIGAWLLLSEILEDSARVYDAAGTALLLLDPGGSPAERDLIDRAMVRRAKAADVLGHAEEAIEAYEKATARLETESPDVGSSDLAESLLRLAALYGKLDRDEEATTTFARISTRFTGNTEPWARDAVAVASAWLEDVTG